MRQAAADRHGWRLRAMMVVLWRAGLRVQEALALAEHDLDPRRESVLVRNGKGGRRREVGINEWGWEQLRPWLSSRAELPLGPLFCIIDGPTRGRAWSGAAVRSEFRRLAAQAGLRRRFAPHQLRHGHALELAARASGSTSLSASSGTPTSARPRSTCKESPRGIIATVRTRRAPMMSASARAATLIDPGTTRERPGAPASPCETRPDGERPLDRCRSSLASVSRRFRPRPCGRRARRPAAFVTVDADLERGRRVDAARRRTLPHRRDRADDGRRGSRSTRRGRLSRFSAGGL
jgi:Phage integrase family